MAHWLAACDHMSRGAVYFGMFTRSSPLSCYPCRPPLPPFTASSVGVLLFESDDNGITWHQTIVARNASRGHDAVWVAAADISGDGHLDVLSGWVDPFQTSSTIFWHEGGPDAGWRTQLVNQIGGPVSSMASAE